MPTIYDVLDARHRQQDTWGCLRSWHVTADSSDMSATTRLHAFKHGQGQLRYCYRRLASTPVLVFLQGIFTTHPHPCYHRHQAGQHSEPHAWHHTPHTALSLMAPQMPSALALQPAQQWQSLSSLEGLLCWPTSIIIIPIARLSLQGQFVTLHSAHLSSKHGLGSLIVRAHKLPRELQHHGHWRT